MTYYSTKTYCHNEGLSCAFRQWKATHSHCKFLHGYAIQVGFVFGANSLDDRNWVQDFGSLEDIKKWLKEMFDHTTCVSSDDPELETFQELDKKGLITLKVLPGVGCEKFAEYIFEYVSAWLSEVQKTRRVWLDSVEVREHGANSAIYKP